MSVKLNIVQMQKIRYSGLPSGYQDTEGVLDEEGKKASFAEMLLTSV